MDFIRRHSTLTRRAVLAAIVLPVAGYVVLPYFTSTSVNETLPVTGGAGPSVGQAPAAPAQSGNVQPAASVPQAQTGPRNLVSGSFADVDPIHKGSGKASILQNADGATFVRFEQFQVTNGPDLFVYLSAHPKPRSANELHAGGDLELGRLKGSTGDQNYQLPAGMDVTKFKSVVVYCKQFSVVFSSAELMTA